MKSFLLHIIVKIAFLYPNNSKTIVQVFPITVSNICLTMDEVVWPKKGSDAASSHTVHRTGLQVHQQGPGDIFTTCKQNGSF